MLAARFRARFRLAMRRSWPPRIASKSIDAAKTSPSYASGTASGSIMKNAASSRTLLSTSVSISGVGSDMARPLRPEDLHDEIAQRLGAERLGQERPGAAVQDLLDAVLAHRRRDD